MNMIDMWVWLIWAGRGALALWISGFLLFALYSLAEKEWRAFKRSLLFSASSGALLLFGFVSPSLELFVIIPICILTLALILAVLFSPRPDKKIQLTKTPDRVDERDVIFARFDLVPGSSAFDAFYERRPQFKDVDQEIRRLPDILIPERISRSTGDFSLAAAEFDYLEHQLTAVDGPVHERIHEGSPGENRMFVDKALSYLGAKTWGVCELDRAYLYSHVGRGPVPYGQPIESSHGYAVLFTVEMSREMIQEAPGPPVIVETARRYIEAADISIQLAGWLRRMGFSARAHIAGSNYQASLVPLAWAAGLGELARMGILITPRFGPRVRLGLVTTELPLTVDGPLEFGVQDFCMKCLKCARSCPSTAISPEAPREDNGVLRWVINREECYRYWRKVGTDCSVCVSVCPYSKADNLLHGAVRRMASKSKVFQSLSVRGDDLFYGRLRRHKSGASIFPVR
jgi:ferredoxin